MTPPHVVVLATLAELGGAERSLVEVLHGVRGALRASLVLPDDGPLAAAATPTAVNPAPIASFNAPRASLSLSRVTTGSVASAAPSRISPSGVT